MANREKIIGEIRETEEKYVCMMKNVLIDLFITPLRASVGKDAIKEETILVLFSNLESIYTFSAEHLLPQLKSTDNVGQVFRNLNPFFRLYENYLGNYEKALNMHLQLEKAKNPIYKALCEALENKEKLSLPSFIIQPVQRVPRYILLLQSLLDSTLPTHPDYNSIKTALEDLKSMTQQLNQRMKQSKSDFSEQVLQLSSKTRKLMEDVLLPHRKIVKVINVAAVFTESGNLEEESWKKMKKWNFEGVIFNDLLMFFNCDTSQSYTLYPAHFAYQYKKYFTIQSPELSIQFPVSPKERLSIEKELTQFLISSQSNNNHEINYTFNNGISAKVIWSSDYSSFEGALDLQRNETSYLLEGVWKKASLLQPQPQQGEDRYQFQFLNFVFVSGEVTEFYYGGNDQSTVANHHNDHHLPPASSSSKMIKEKSPYLHGVKHGDSHIFYTTGELAKIIHYSDGKKHGECHSFHKNGNRAGLCHYQDDSVYGDYLVWHSNGQLAERAFMVDNWFEGPYERWYADGSPGEFFVYRNRVCVEYRSVLKNLIS